LVEADLGQFVSRAEELRLSPVQLPNLLKAVIAARRALRIFAGRVVARLSAVGHLSLNRMHQRARVFVISLVRSQQPAEVLLAEHHDMIKALPSDRVDEPLHMSILPW